MIKEHLARSIDLFSPLVQRRLRDSEWWEVDRNLIVSVKTGNLLDEVRFPFYVHSVMRDLNLPHILALRLNLESEMGESFLRELGINLNAEKVKNTLIPQDDSSFLRRFRIDIRDAPGDLPSELGHQGCRHQSSPRRKGDIRVSLKAVGGICGNPYFFTGFPDRNGVEVGAFYKNILSVLLH
ncbi:hypothetical protein ES703_35368 [subsurface metagenome]